ncbi:MAG: hypothetical protein K2N58_00710 [Treponemataceae bacterium]|nr:hypothetical protein [Treponemataceae bacterium]
MSGSHFKPPPLVVVNDSGADVNAKGDKGSTALIRAAGVGNKDMAEMLIKAGADVNAKNYDKESSLTKVAHGYRNCGVVDRKNRNYKGTAELLITAGADSGVALVEIIKKNSYLYSAEILINAGADVNAKDSEGISVLTYAILYGDKDMEKLLRAAGAKE